MRNNRDFRQHSKPGTIKGVWVPAYPATCAIARAFMTSLLHFRYFFSAAAIFFLSGCASIGTPAGFAGCAAADVATTAYGLSVNRMHEVDPLVKALTIHGLGRVAGAVVPVIGLSVLAYYGLKWLDKPTVTAVASSLECAGAARNLWIAR